MQLRGPVEKGCRTSKSSSGNRAGSRKRAGLKASGSLKLRALWLAGHCAMLTTVPSATNCPAMVPPPGGTTRGICPATGG